MAAIALFAVALVASVASPALALLTGVVVLVCGALLVLWGIRVNREGGEPRRSERADRPAETKWTTTRETPYGSPLSAEAAQLENARREARTLAFAELKKTDRLPSPGGTVWRIQKLVREGKKGASDLTRIVRGDPALAAKLLQYVNAPWNRPVDKIDSIGFAIARIGQTKLATLALSLSIGTRYRHGDCGGFDYEAFWNECTLRATAAQFVVHRSWDDVAFTSGLLCQIGRLALATALPEQYATVLKHPGAGRPEGLLQLERRMFGIDHNELAAEMVGDWGLSEYVRQALLFQDDEHMLAEWSREHLLANVLRWTGEVWEICRSGGAVSREILDAAAASAGQLRLLGGGLPESFDRIVAEWKEVAGWFNVSPPAVPAWSEVYGSDDRP